MEREGSTERTKITGRENREQKVVRKNGRSVEHVVVLNFTP